MKTRWLAASAALALALVVAFSPSRAAPSTAQVGPAMGQPLEQLSGDAFDRAFLMQMTMHHAMAVMMARPLLANAEHPELQDLGSRIIADQTREIAQMRAWAKAWYGLDMPDLEAMMEAMASGQMPSPGMPTGNMPMEPGRMGPGPMGNGPMMPMGQGQMGGMGQMSMMADLWKLPPNRLEAVFMSLMIPHHEGAIEMANLVPDRAAHQELKEFARQIVQSQSAEIHLINAWLTAWYGL